MRELFFQRKIPIKYQTEICIVGGGPSGIAAAISAARMGRQVVVAESQGCFGGAATNALVPAFMSFDNGVDFLVGGIGREVYNRCIQQKGICLNGSALGIHPEKLKQIYDDMMVASGAKVSFFTQLIDVFAENGRVSHAVFASKSGIFAIEAKIFIDATSALSNDMTHWEQMDGHEKQLDVVYRVWQPLEPESEGRRWKRLPNSAWRIMLP